MDARSSGLASDSLSEAVSTPVLRGSGWRTARGEPSLAGMFGSVQTAKQGSFWRQLLACLGPGYLVAVGYMDPGNWATSLAGGCKFGYSLLFVALLSNVMAIVLQSLCTRLGVGAGRDLAQACRDSYARLVSWPLWLSAEIAITATDLAEVIGTAIGLNLLFHIPLEIGVIITAADVFLILALQAFGFRWIEAFVVAMLGVIAACFAVQIAMADPDWGAVLRGFAPTSDIFANHEMLYLALGILGATVMPHNLYLHSGLVQTRGYGDSIEEKREAITLATIDSSIALWLALTVTIWAGEKATGQLLILSQVVLSLQLPFAVVPLVMFTASRAKMGPFVAPRWLTVLAALTAVVIIALNAKLVFDYVIG